MAADSSVSTRARKSSVKSFSEISVREMLAIQGGAKKEPTLVPVIPHGGRLCVAIHKKATWLMQHAFGSSEYLLKDSQCQAVNHVVERLHGNATSDTTNSLDDSMSETDVPPPAKPRALRKLGLGDSDPPSPKKAAPKKKSSKAAAKDDFVVHELDEIRLMIKRRPNGGLLIVADAKAIQAVVNLVRKAWEDGKESQKQSRLKRKAEREEAMPRVDDEDKGRISWNFRFASWQIHYKEEADAPVKICMKGLRVNELDFAGRMLSGAEFQERRQQVYMKAQRLWNTMDQSDKERYPED